jgi:hypothetical protein
MSRIFRVLLLTLICFYFSKEASAQLFILNGNNAQTFCNGDTLTLTCTQGLSNYRWFIEFDSVTTLSTTTSFSLTTELNGFFYFVTATGPGNAYMRDSVFVKSFEKPVFSLGVDKFLCPGDVATLSQPVGIPGTGAISRLWNTGSTANSIIASTSGTYWLRISRTAATLVCSFTDTIQVITTSGPVVSITNDTTICNGTSLTLNATLISANLPVTYSWTPEASLSNPFIANPVATPSSTTTYRLIVADQSIVQCNTDTTFVTVTVTPPINVSISPSIANVCPDSVIQVSATATGSNPPYSYRWIPGTGVLDSLSNNTSILAVSSRTYQLRATNAIGCFGTANFPITVNSLNVIIPQRDTVLCEGRTYALNTNVFGGIAPYQFSWNRNPPLLSNPNLSNPIASPTASAQPLIYRVTVRDGAGCSRSDSVSIGTRPNPMVTVNPKFDSVRVFNSLPITAEGSGGTGSVYLYEWSPNNVNISNNDSAQIIFTGSIASLGLKQYTVIVIDEKGCISLPDTATIVTFALPGDSVNLVSRNILYIPRYFRPSSTITENAALKIFGTKLDAEELSFNVYSKWGNVVFQSTSLDQMQTEGWNGKLNNTGEELPQGVYSFTFEGRFEDGSSIKKSGTIILIR